MMCEEDIKRVKGSKPKVKVYHGMKGERITMNDNKKRRRRYKSHAGSYNDQQRKDLLFAAVFCFTIAIVCLVIIL